MNADSKDSNDNQIRKDLMSAMAEISYNPANVTVERQEQVALFMVEQLRGSMYTPPPETPEKGKN